MTRTSAQIIVVPSLDRPTHTLRGRAPNPRTRAPLAPPTRLRVRRRTPVSLALRASRAAPAAQAVLHALQALTVVSHRPRAPPVPRASTWLAHQLPVRPMPALTAPRDPTAALLHHHARHALLASTLFSPRPRARQRLAPSAPPALTLPIQALLNAQHARLALTAVFLHHHARHALPASTSSSPRPRTSQRPAPLAELEPTASLLDLPHAPSVPPVPSTLTRQRPLLPMTSSLTALLAAPASSSKTTATTHRSTTPRMTAKDVHP